MTAPAEPRDYGPVRGLLVPTLTGVAASGLLVASWAFGQGGLTVIGPLILVGGAVAIGFVVGNPGNEAATLAGTLLPGILLAAIEPHHACLASVGLWIVVSLVAGIGLMFVGLIGGIIVGRDRGIGPMRRPAVLAVLAVVDL